MSGVWTVYAPGALQLGQSGLPTARIEPTPAQIAALAARTPPDRAPDGTPGIPTPLEDSVLPHLASPDVHVDDANQRIVMYFHGLTGFGVQLSRVATSVDGITFTPRDGTLGSPYLRAFDHGGYR